VIVLGLDADSVYVEDPSLLGCRGIIPRAEFLERWHDYEGRPPFDAGRRVYMRMGIFIEGRPAVPAHPYCRVD
jgi:predicted double-glycine peptidase